MGDARVIRGSIHARRMREDCGCCFVAVASAVLLFALMCFLTYQHEAHRKPSCYLTQIGDTINVQCDIPEPRLPFFEDFGHEKTQILLIEAKRELSLPFKTWIKDQDLATLLEDGEGSIMTQSDQQEGSIATLDLAPLALAKGRRYFVVAVRRMQGTKNLRAIIQTEVTEMINDYITTRDYLRRRD